MGGVPRKTGKVKWLWMVLEGNVDDPTRNMWAAQDSCVLQVDSQFCSSEWMA